MSSGDSALVDFCCFRFVMIHIAITHCYKLESFFNLIILTVFVDAQ